MQLEKANKRRVMYGMCEHAVTEETDKNYGRRRVRGRAPRSFALTLQIRNACTAVSSHTIYCGRHKSLK